MDILATHAATHPKAATVGVRHSGPQRACRACGGTRGFLERVTYDGAPAGGALVHWGCLAAFFRQLDGLADGNKAPVGLQRRAQLRGERKASGLNLW
jgi:hypothetical protein